jgi:hypothetical protein
VRQSVVHHQQPVAIVHRVLPQQLVEVFELPAFAGGAHVQLDLVAGAQQSAVSP